MQTSRYYVVDQIIQALYILMGEKDYSDITVTEVIKRAQVSRASFYRHFSSIGDERGAGRLSSLQHCGDFFQSHVLYPEQE